MNGYIKRSVWITTTLLGCLMQASSAQAASFDCAKAQSKVEHLICDNPEISKLDDELSATYKVVLQDEKLAGANRQTQKLWMKERNGCSDATCVKAAYEARLIILKSSVGKAGSRFTGQWHLDLCDTAISEECGGFTVYLIQIGKNICGDHFFATPGGGRLNEGAPRSISGSIVGNNVADIEITSGRNGAIFKVQVTENGDILKWNVIKEIEAGEGEDSPLILDKGSLKREAEDGSYQEALSACQSL
jgi:uncharacterized protein YecT (DUF1311 family)